MHTCIYMHMCACVYTCMTAIFVVRKCKDLEPRGQEKANEKHAMCACLACLACLHAACLRSRFPRRSSKSHRSSKSYRSSRPSQVNHIGQVSHIGQVGQVKSVTRETIRIYLLPCVLACIHACQPFVLADTLQE